MPKQINKHYQTLKDAGYELEPRSGAGGWNSLYAVKDGDRKAGFKYRSNNQSHSPEDFKYPSEGTHRGLAVQDLCEDLNLEVKQGNEKTPEKLAESYVVVVHDERNVELQFGEIGVSYKFDQNLLGKQDKTIQRESMRDECDEKVGRAGSQIQVPDNLSLDAHLDPAGTITSICQRDAAQIEDQDRAVKAEKQNDSTEEKSEGMAI
jgi:hypothetical protein